MSPRVSVVMATHNRAQLVGRAIASVRGQSLVDWEMICVDDGSTDETAAVIQAIGEPRVRLIRLPRNRGASHARNVGIDAARADYVAFLDDDNEWAPAMLEALLARAADPDGAPPGVVYCLAYRENDATGRFAPPWRLIPRGDVFRRLLEGWNPWLSCVIVHRPALTAAGAFDESLPAFEDYDLFLRLAANGARFVGVSRPLLIRHEHHGRGAASGDPVRLRRGLEGLDRKWREAILGRTGRATYRRWRARLHAGVEFVAVRNAVGRGQRWSAWRRVAAMGRYLPWSIHFPALAAVLVVLGPTGYDRLAHLRDAVLRYGRDERPRRA